MSGDPQTVTDTPLPVIVSRFASLFRTDVAERIETDWETWLSQLSAAPSTAYASQADHGGWSPADYDPAKRAKDNVRRVYGLVLDHDKAGDWQRLRALWSSSYGVIYTTKSHGAPDTEGDRLRVVLPLSRPVTADEYSRVWDWAAAQSAGAGCPADAQCKDASRFWYDPSTPPGGWRAERLTGVPINPDAVLAVVAEERPRLSVVRPSTPLSTDDRARRASAYLATIPGAVSGQAGHTATFNAVAHVMIGFDLDEATTYQMIADEYNPRCEPPWSERELRHKIDSVGKQCKRERGYLLKDRPRVFSTVHAAAHAPAAPVELDVDWTTHLIVKKDRTPKREFHNTMIFVRHHPRYRGKWSMDMRTESPWFDGAPMTASFISDIRGHAGQALGFTPSPADVEAAIVKAAEDRKFHPILQYLRSLDWDGEPRLSAMARDYLGSDEPHHAEMLKKFMVGAAARVLNPGCKLDTALMLVGDQGLFKSTFFSILGGEWHADSFIDISNKDSFLQLHSAWIYELAELENVVTGRAESRLKAWMTSTHDMYRAPYQKTVIRRPRSVVICGTTNRERFLTDDTGSRRFWIIPVRNAIPRDLLEQCRDQLWAEAVCCYEARETWWLGQSTEIAREEANRDFAEDDSWLQPIAEYLENPNHTETSITEVLTLGVKLDVSRHDRLAQMRASRILKQLGWHKIQRRVGDARPRFYIRNLDRNVPNHGSDGDK